MPLIQEILACAEQDLNVDNILKFIIAANPKLQNELYPSSKDANSELSAEQKKAKIIEQLVILIALLYNSWISRVTGRLCLAIDIAKYGLKAQSEIPNFCHENKFPDLKGIKLSEDFYQILRATVTSVLNETLSQCTEPQDNYVFQIISKSCKDAENIDSAIKKLQLDANRYFHEKSCKIVDSPNFQRAIEIIKEPLIQHLDKTCAKPPQKVEEQTTVNAHSAPTSTKSGSFFGSFFARFSTNSADTSTHPLLVPETPGTTTTESKLPNISSDTTKTPDLITALGTYKKQRKEVEKSDYHLWGSLFSFTGIPFSLEEKENAVNKIIYWKLRQQDQMKGDDQLNQFTPRDIAAIHDRRLGVLCEKYKDELTKLFEFAESKKINDETSEQICCL